MLRRAKIVIREAEYQEDFKYMSELATLHRPFYSPSGQPWELEALNKITPQAYEASKSSPSPASLWIGTVSAEPAGFMVCRHHVPDSVVPTEKVSVVYALSVEDRFRGSKLFREFLKLAIGLKDIYRDSRLISVVRHGKELSFIGPRLGWSPTRTEFEYSPRMRGQFHSGNGSLPLVESASEESGKAEEPHTPLLPVELLEEE